MGLGARCRAGFTVAAVHRAYGRDWQLVTNITPDGFLRVDPAGGIPIRDSHSIEAIDMHDLDTMIEVVKGLISDGAWRK